MEKRSFIIITAILLATGAAGALVYLLSDNMSSPENTEEAAQVPVETITPVPFQENGLSSSPTPLTAAPEETFPSEQLTATVSEISAAPVAPTAATGAVGLLPLISVLGGVAATAITFLRHKA